MIRPDFFNYNNKDIHIYYEEHHNYKNLQSFAYYLCQDEEILIIDILSFCNHFKI